MNGRQSDAVLFDDFMILYIQFTDEKLFQGHMEVM
jgi:hypothetical protein